MSHARRSNSILRNGGDHYDGGRKEMHTDIIITASSDEYDPIEESQQKYKAREELIEEDHAISCADIWDACCSHSCHRWFVILMHTTCFLGLLYFFFLGIELIGSSAQVIGGCMGGDLLSKTTSPVTCIALGILATSIFQSQSVTNIIIASFLDNGISVRQGIYISMGANLGSSVVSTIISFAHMTHKSSFERAVSGASVSDIYYMLTISVMLPLEAASGALYKISEAIVKDGLTRNSTWKGLIGFAVSPLSKMIVMVNQSTLNGLANGDIASCSSLYPVTCIDGDKSYTTCNTAIIGCNEKTGSCPLFFRESPSLQSDQLYSLAPLAIGIALILICFHGMVYLINKMIVALPIEIIAEVSNVNSYIAMLLGCSFSLLCGSSSVAQTAIIPFTGAGVIDLEQMYPWSIGTGIGMSVFTMLASMAAGEVSFMKVAMANVFFHLFGMVLWYPIPFLRSFPIHGALIVGIISSTWRILLFGYIGVVFVLIPLLFYTIVNLLTSDKKGLVAAGGLIISFLSIIFIYFCYWWYCSSGRDRFLSYFEDIREEENDISVGSGSEDQSSIETDEEQNNSPPGILRNRSVDPKLIKRQISNIAPRIPVSRTWSGRRNHSIPEPRNSTVCCSDVFSNDENY
jgi:sodium-dependent phosphate cotransporter